MPPKPPPPPPPPPPAPLLGEATPPPFDGPSPGGRPTKAFIMRNRIRGIDYWVGLWLSGVVFGFCVRAEVGSPRRWLSSASRAAPSTRGSPQWSIADRAFRSLRRMHRRWRGWTSHVVVVVVVVGDGWVVVGREVWGDAELACSQRDAPNGVGYP
jgi:hypothetical protein